MALYKTKVTTGLWTKAGYDGGTIPADTVFNSTTDIYIAKRDVDCYILDDTKYAGKCLPKQYADPYIPPDQPPTTPPMPPPEVAFRWRDAAGNITIEQVYIKKPL